MKLLLKSLAETPAAAVVAKPMFAEAFATPFSAVPMAASVLRPVSTLKFEPAIAKSVVLDRPLSVTSLLVVDAAADVVSKLPVKFPEMMSSVTVACVTSV